MSKSWFTVARSGKVGEIRIYSDIGAGGLTAQDFHAQLSRLKAQGVTELHLFIQSNGGDTAEGYAITTMLNRWTGKKIVFIDGIAASMASVIAMSGDEVVIAEGAFIMIHNPWGVIAGEAQQVSSFGEALAAIRENIIGSYMKKTGLDKATVAAMMDKETWMDAKEAVRLKFADRIEYAQQKIAALGTQKPDVTKFRNAPASLRTHGLESITEAIFAKFNRKPVRRPNGGLTKDGRP